VRGKTKIGTSALLVAMMLTMAFAVSPAFAIGTIGAPDIVNPLMAPGNSFSFDITVKGFGPTELINKIEFKVQYDTSVLTATGIVSNPVTPVLMKAIYKTIDDTTGTVTFGEQRPSGGFDASDILLVAIMTFSVDARGVSPITFYDVVITDPDGVVIPATVKSGSFDNQLQGIISAPHIVDTSLVNIGDYFDVYVTIGPWMSKPVDHLWGFQFVMSFDPTILAAVDFETLSIFTPGPSELGVDYAAITGQSYYGDPVGLTTNVPVQVARIGFVVLATGVTALSMHDTVMANTGGASMVHEADSGSFANTVNVSVSMNSIFVAGRKWFTSVDGEMFPLTAQVTNTGLGITMTRAHFQVFDSLGVLVADVTTDAIDIMPGTTVRLATMLNVAPLSKPGSYVVQGTVEYFSYLGSWVTGQKGSPTGARSAMVKTFTLYP
jgi:hypothetical protein